MESNILFLFGFIVGYFTAICFYWLERDRRIRAEKSFDNLKEWCYNLLDRDCENNKSQCDKKELNSNE
jgi:hypothetical protein